MKNLILYLIVATDEDKRETTVGYHGYIYSELTERPAKAKTAVLTTMGYLEPGEKNKVKHKLVKPMNYVDGSATLNTNTNFEMLTKVLDIIDDSYDNVIIITKDRYILNTLTTIFNKDEHKESFDRLLNVNNTFQEFTTSIFNRKINKVLSASDSIGFTEAGYGLSLAQHRVRNGKNTYRELKVLPVQKFWTITKHLFPLVRDMKFILVHDETDNHYKVLTYKDEIEIGKYIPDSIFGLVVTKKRHPHIDLLMNVYRDRIVNKNYVSLIDLHVLTSNDVIRLIDRYREEAFVVSQDKNKFEITTIDGSRVMYVLNPPGLTMVVYREMDGLASVLKRFIKHSNKPLVNVSVTNITDNFFIDAKLNPEFTQQVKEFRIPIKVQGKRRTIRIQIGTDAPSRSHFKGLENIIESVLLVTTNTTPDIVKYYTIIMTKEVEDNSMSYSVFCNMNNNSLIL